MSLPHLTTGTLVVSSNWNDAIDAINTALTEIGATGILKRAQSFRGVHLRTHPDADVAASKVQLVTADEIVMDDGARLLAWTPLVADIAASGAGGLDAGSEVASTWYEIYAIAKEDGTRNLLLHRAFNYSLVAQQTNTPTSAGLRSAANSTRLAQSVVASLNPIQFIDVTLTRNGTPTGQVYVEIQTDAAGAPSGSVVATSDKIDASAIATSAQLIRIPFRSKPTLTNGATYWLVFQGTYAISGANFISVSGDTANSYASGQAKSYDGATWGTSGLGTVLDFYFRFWQNNNDTAVTLPTGYTKKCKVGYVYNNSGSNFNLFVAKNTLVTLAPTSVIAGATVTSPTALDISSVVPPGCVVCDVLYSASVAGDITVIAPVPDGYGGLASTNVSGSAPTTNAGSSTTPLRPLITEFQAFYFFRYAGTGTVSLYITNYTW